MKDDLKDKVEKEFEEHFAFKKTYLVEWDESILKLWRKIKRWWKGEK